MTITASRIVKAAHASTAFTGDGARRFGGRWNSPGRPAVYVAGSTSLAMLELLVHLQSRELLRSYVLFEVAFDDSEMDLVDESELPADWRDYPAPAALEDIGDAWLVRASRPVLRVPSVIVPTEWNYLLNPAHAAFGRIRIGPSRPLRFDRRLIGRGERSG